MSSCVVVQCSQGFVISTDSVAFKTPIASSDEKYGPVRVSTRKLFRLHPDIVVAGVGEFNSYTKVFNEVAATSKPANELVEKLLEMSVRDASDSRVFVLHRNNGKVSLHISELGHIRRDHEGTVSFPDPAINGLFSVMFESPYGKAIRQTGMLGVAGLVSAFNAMAVKLSPDLAEPFDTLCFLSKGEFQLSGGITPLPFADIW